MSSVENYARSLVKKEEIELEFYYLVLILCGLVKSIALLLELLALGASVFRLS
jgi:hypothetical protein